MTGGQKLGLLAGIIIGVATDYLVHGDFLFGFFSGAAIGHIIGTIFDPPPPKKYEILFRKFDLKEEE